MLKHLTEWTDLMEVRMGVCCITIMPGVSIILRFFFFVLCYVILNQGKQEVAVKFVKCSYNSFYFYTFLVLLKVHHGLIPWNNINVVLYPPFFFSEKIKDERTHQFPF